MFTLIWLLSGIVMTVFNGLTKNELKFLIIPQKKSKETMEPLLHFPFIYSLINPCHFQSDMFDSEKPQTSSVTLRDLAGNGEISLAQQALDFLTPYRDLIDVRSVNELPHLNESKWEEEQSALIQEFKLVVAQVLLLVHRIYTPLALDRCNGFQLESLPQDNFFVGSSTVGDIQLGKLYRSLLIIAAQLNAIVEDIYDSKGICLSESVAHLQILRQLIGKVQTSLCLTLHLAVVTKREENLDFFGITREFLQSFIRRYYSCSARKMRECLVMNYTHEIFSFVQRYLDY